MMMKMNNFWDTKRTFKLYNSKTLNNGELILKDIPVNDTKTEKTLVAGSQESLFALCNSNSIHSVNYVKDTVQT